MRDLALVLTAHDPHLGRSRAVAFSADRGLIEQFLTRLVAEAEEVERDCEAGPFSLLERTEAERLRAVASLIGVRVDARGDG